MGFPDLLEQADLLLDGWRGNAPNQASIRRAVSTAYYSLFHLLIDEAVGNWSVSRQRSVLARTFEHRGMKKVCEDYVACFYKLGKPLDGLRLTDYDNSRT